MAKYRRVSGSQTVDFAAALKERLGKEEIELAVSAGTVDVPRGHLAVIFTLSLPDTSLDQRLRAERIAKEECIKYLQDGRKRGNNKFTTRRLQRLS
jgi:hypothetical protein